MRIFLAISVMCFIVALSYGLLKKIVIKEDLVSELVTAENVIDADSEELQQKPAAKVNRDIVLVSKFLKNESLYEKLNKLSIGAQQRYKLIQAIRSVFDVKSIKPGMSFVLSKTHDNQLKSFKLQLSVEKFIFVDCLQEGSWQASIEKIDLDTIVYSYSGSVEVSLWESALQSGLGSVAIDKMVDIFAYQIDFARQVRKADTWNLIIEKKMSADKFIRWGRVLVAQYSNQGRVYDAIRYTNTKGDVDYYDRQGLSVKGLFLKSPIKYKRISSRFSHKRFHPVLGIKRPHLGVDYAAKTGTPIAVVGDGLVLRANYSRSGGKSILIKHSRVYRTAYKHLHRFAKGIRKGKRVKQGQIIGYVGSTGLATGPHLHFEFHRHGRHIDPLGQKFPRKSSLAREEISNLTKVYQSHMDLARSAL
jgi:hypothetical protein